jgi:hypothetical protein
VQERPPIWLIFPVVLSGCETWSLSFREEGKLSVFENRVARRIYGPKRDEVTGKWRRLQKQVLNDLFSSTNIDPVIEPIRMRWAGHVTRMGENRGAYMVLAGKPE